MKYIPFDKSWIIRMGVLDMLGGYEDTSKFLEAQDLISDDLIALRQSIASWHSNEPIDVGESGTLYRFLQFASWKLGLNKRFIKRGTLEQREVGSDPSITKLSQYELLHLEGEPTSQWASAAVLLGDKERLENAPFKLKLTYEAVDHWRSRRHEGKCWQARPDRTIEVQASAFIDMLAGKKVDFTPLQAEDYCFARTFGYISATEGERRWPTLAGHESNRLKEMDEVIGEAQKGRSIGSKDHRVVQAIVMWGMVNHKSVNVLYPDCVRKSWPEFWQFIKSLA